MTNMSIRVQQCLKCWKPKYQFLGAKYVRLRGDADCHCAGRGSDIRTGPKTIANGKHWRAKESSSEMKDSVAIGLMAAIQSLEARVEALEANQNKPSSANVRSIEAMTRMKTPGRFAGDPKNKPGPRPSQSDPTNVDKIPPSKMPPRAFAFEKIADLIRRMTEGMNRKAVSLTDLQQQWKKEGGNTGSFKSYIRSEYYGFGRLWFSAGQGRYTTHAPTPVLKEGKK